MRPRERVRARVRRVADANGRSLARATRRDGTERPARARRGAAGKRGVSRRARTNAGKRAKGLRADRLDRGRAAVDRERADVARASDGGRGTRGTRDWTTRREGAGEREDAVWKLVR